MKTIPLLSAFIALGFGTPLRADVFQMPAGEVGSFVHTVSPEFGNCPVNSHFKNSEIIRRHFDSERLKWSDVESQLKFISKKDLDRRLGEIERLETEYGGEDTASIHCKAENGVRMDAIIGRKRVSISTTPCNDTKNFRDQDGVVRECKELILVALEKVSFEDVHGD